MALERWVLIVVYELKVGLQSIYERKDIGGASRRSETLFVWVYAILVKTGELPEPMARAVRVMERIWREC